MRYNTLDGKVFEAQDLEDLANQLWQSKFLPEPTIQEWMTGSAARAELYNGAAIRSDTVANHIHDLITAGFIVPQEEA
ncbi:hypothetical protein DSECCO2_608630 [anaerobic digester metagenome]